MMAGMAPPVMELRKVCIGFAKPSGEPLPVLADIDVILREGEILGLLGRSGSGKSTLLRIAGGLIKATSADVLYQGKRLAGPAEGVALVFRPSPCTRGSPSSRTSSWASTRSACRSMRCAGARCRPSI